MTLIMVAHDFIVKFLFLVSCYHGTPTINVPTMNVGTMNVGVNLKSAT